MGKLGGVASAEVDASIQEIWDVVVDIESAPEWQNGLNDVDVLERDDEGRCLVAETESDAKVKTVKARMRFTYEEPHLVEWRQEKGDVKSLVGAWELEEIADDRTKVDLPPRGRPGARARHDDPRAGRGQDPPDPGRGTPGRAGRARRRLSGAGARRPAGRPSYLTQATTSGAISVAASICSNSSRNDQPARGHVVGASR